MGFKKHSDRSNIPAVSVIDPRLLEVIRWSAILEFSFEHCPSPFPSKSANKIDCRTSARETLTTLGETDWNVVVLDTEFGLPSGSRPSSLLAKDRGYRETNLMRPSANLMRPMRTTRSASSQSAFCLFGLRRTTAASHLRNI